MCFQYGMPFYKRKRYILEQQRMSQFAPRIRCKGPHIRKQEKLCRVVFDPDHVRDNKIYVEGISRADLTHKGFSIFRIKYSSRLQVNNFVQNSISNKKERTLMGGASFTAYSVRDFLDKDGSQAFIIVDDAPTLDLAGHALILVAGDHKPSHIKELRKKLASLLENFQALDTLPFNK